MDSASSCQMYSDDDGIIVLYDETQSNSSLDDFLHIDHEHDEESYQRNALQNNNNNNNNHAQSNHSAESGPPSYHNIFTPLLPLSPQQQQQQAQTNDMLSQILNEVKDMKLEHSRELKEVKLQMRNTEGELKQVKSQLREVQKDMSQVKLQMVRKFIQELVSTKEFSKSLRATLGKDGKPDLIKFMREIEGSDERGLGAIIKRLQRENELSDKDLIEIVNEALKLNPEVAKEVGLSSNLKKGLVVGGAVAVFVLLILLL